ncbi:hypothetical protein MC885_013260, partial [Smutsia gigantea]
MQAQDERYPPGGRGPLREEKGLWGSSGAAGPSAQQPDPHIHGPSQKGQDLPEPAARRALGRGECWGPWPSPWSPRAAKTTPAARRALGRSGSSVFVGWRQSWPRLYLLRSCTLDSGAAVRARREGERGRGPTRGLEGKREGCAHVCGGVTVQAPSSGYGFGDYCVTSAHTMHILNPSELGQQAVYSPQPGLLGDIGPHEPCLPSKAWWAWLGLGTAGCTGPRAPSDKDGWARKQLKDLEVVGGGQCRGGQREEGTLPGSQAHGDHTGTTNPAGPGDQARRADEPALPEEGGQAVRLPAEERPGPGEGGHWAAGWAWVLWNHCRQCVSPQRMKASEHVRLKEESCLQEALEISGRRTRSCPRSTCGPCRGSSRWAAVAVAWGLGTGAASTQQQEEGRRVEQCQGLDKAVAKRELEGMELKSLEGLAQCQKETKAHLWGCRRRWTAALAEAVSDKCLLHKSDSDLKISAEGKARTAVPGEDELCCPLGRAQLSQKPYCVDKASPGNPFWPLPCSSLHRPSSLISVTCWGHPSLHYSVARLSAPLAPCAHREFEVGAMRQDLAALLSSMQQLRVGHPGWKIAKIQSRLATTRGPQGHLRNQLSCWVSQPLGAPSRRACLAPPALWVSAVSVNGVGIGLGGTPGSHGARTGCGCPQLGALPIRRLCLVSEPNDETGKQPLGQQSHPEPQASHRDQAGERRAPSPPPAWPTPQSFHRSACLRFPADKTLVCPEGDKALVSPASCRISVFSAGPLCLQCAEGMAALRESVMRLWSEEGPWALTLGSRRVLTSLGKQQFFIKDVAPGGVVPVNGWGVYRAVRLAVGAALWKRS